MPYLQLDVNGAFPREKKQRLAQQMADDYAAMMAVDPRRISVAIRECGDGAVWRFVDGMVEPNSVLMLDIRRGRPAELRMEVAKKLIANCVATLGLPPDRVNVEFTQHSGDEMYHPTLGGYSPDWSKDDASPDG